MNSWITQTNAEKRAIAIKALEKAKELEKIKNRKKSNTTD